jgi:hypothetical protein
MGDDQEPRYTLAEAVEVMARYECSVHGHDFEIAINDINDPVRIYCARNGCHKSWVVDKSLSESKSA